MEDLARQRLSLSQGDAAEHERPSPWSGWRMLGRGTGRPQHLAASRLHGEGYRKLWARLRFAGVRASPRRVRRVMRANGLPKPPTRERSENYHFVCTRHNSPFTEIIMSAPKADQVLPAFHPLLLEEPIPENGRLEDVGARQARLWGGTGPGMQTAKAVHALTTIHHSKGQPPLRVPLSRTAAMRQPADNPGAQQSPPRVGLFVTCLADTMRPRLGFAALQLLEAAGCDVTVPRAQTCCGQPAFNSGDTKGAAAIARQVIALFESLDYLVAPSGSCAG